MALSTRQTVVPLWHYHCPSCGVADSDMGHLAAHEAIYCEVCLEDGEQIRLRRWQPAEVATS